MRCATSEPAPEGTQPALTVEEYVAHMAALSVAVEEGLSGREAADRAIELGGGGHTREEVEAFTDAMRRLPEEWAAVEIEVSERMKEIRRSRQRAGSPAADGAGPARGD